MGCSSSSIYDSSDESSDGVYVELRSTPRKRNFSSRINSTAESNYAKPQRCASSSTSGWSSDGMRSPASVPSTPPRKGQQLKRSPAFRKPNRKYARVSNKLKATPETPQKQQPQQSERMPQYRTLERSYGYYSGGSTDDLDSSWSTFSCNSILLNTQDMSNSSVESSNAPECDEPVSNLKMEILMIRENEKIMPNTSSPIAQRRGVSFTNYVNYTPPTGTYCRWRKNLHEAPAYSTCNISHLPEAVAGLFGPLTQPAYIYKQDFEYVSAPKRYCVDSRTNKDHSAPSVPLAAVVPGYGVARTIESTEL
ncbi:uncharacterized protein LOC128856579 [Anastrepha ludens]|nr:uncharacterized protein LOC128856579 [Anastrepha ludens]